MTSNTSLYSINTLSFVKAKFGFDVSLDSLDSNGTLMEGVEVVEVTGILIKPTLYPGLREI